MASPGLSWQGFPVVRMLQTRKRVMIVGSGGAGKSTFARKLSDQTGLPLIHLDRIFWNPGWIPTPSEQWEECVRNLCKGERWIVDGNYSGSLSIRMERCDAIVFLDLPRTECLRGVLCRWLAHRSSPRPELPEGCQETLNREFLRWIWDYPSQTRPKILAALESAGPTVEIVTIRRRKQTRQILDSLET